MKAMKWLKFSWYLLFGYQLADQIMVGCYRYHGIMTIVYLFLGHHTMDKKVNPRCSQLCPNRKHFSVKSSLTYKFSITPRSSILGTPFWRKLPGKITICQFAEKSNFQWPLLIFYILQRSPLLLQCFSWSTYSQRKLFIISIDASTAFWHGNKRSY